MRGVLSRVRHNRKSIISFEVKTSQAYARWCCDVRGEVSSKLADHDTKSTQRMAARLSGIIHTRNLIVCTEGGTSNWSELS